MVAMFLAAMDQTILASALPAIVASLGGFADLSWVVVAYLLAATVSAPLYGHLGDRFGRRRMLLVALGVFVAASVACAAAQRLPHLILARAVQGLGGGGLMTLSQALIGESVPPRERAQFQAYFGALFLAASTSGPVLGAYLTEHASWRAVFLINLPLGAVAALLALRIPAQKVTRAAAFRFDAAGALLFAAGAISLLFALSSAGHRYAWTSPALIGLVALACASFAVLAWWERRAIDPVIPVRLLAKRAILRSNAVVMCFAAALFSAVLYLPLYLQLGRGFGIGESGLLLLPIALSIAFASMLTGQAVARTGWLKPYPVLGLSVSTAAFIALALTVTSASTTVVLLLTVVAGAGLGTVMSVAQIVVQEAAGKTALGSATASISVSRSIGGALGVALVGAVLSTLLARRDAGAAAQLSELARNGTATLGALSEAQRAVLAAQLHGAFRVVFLMIGTITGLGAAVAMTVPSTRL
jgi:EmrB/QacA subfamily drug resistance transporter